MNVFILIGFILAFFFGAVMHENDIHKACMEKGRSDMTIWFHSELQCSKLK